MTPQQAAYLKGVHHRTVMRAIGRGDLSAETLDGPADGPGARYILRRSDVENWTPRHYTMKARRAGGKSPAAKVKYHAKAATQHLQKIAALMPDHGPSVAYENLEGIRRLIGYWTEKVSNAD